MPNRWCTSIALSSSCEAAARIPASPSGPAAPLSLLDWSLEYADYVLLLAVNPGFGGQEFQPAVLNKVRALRAELARRGLSTIVESDGGINERTIADFAAAGVDAFVVGSGHLRDDRLSGHFARMRREVERGMKSAAARIRQRRDDHPSQRDLGARGSRKRAPS